jgi:hypothetical protein
MRSTPSLIFPSETKDYLSQILLYGTMTLTVTTFSIEGLFAILSITTFCKGCNYSECCCAECHVLFIVMLTVVLLSVIILSAIMLSVVKLSVIVLSVVTGDRSLP